MMPQDSGPVERHSLSIALGDHVFEEVPTIEPTGGSIWIYTILEKKINDCEVSEAKDENI